MIRSAAFLLLVLMLLLSQISFSQKKEDGDDVYGTSKPTEAKYIPMVDNVEFTIDYFTGGTVILTSGQSYHGKLRFNGYTVIFKDSTDQTKRYSANELKGFIAKSDTFTVYKDTLIIPPNPHELPLKSKQVIDNHFIKQMMYGDRICLLKKIGWSNIPNDFANWVTPTYGAQLYPHNVFYIRCPNDRQFIEIPKSKKAFKKFVATYLKDNAMLVDIVSNDTMKYKDLEQIINIYNQKN